MAHGKEYVSFIVEDRDQISEFIGQISSEMQQHVTEATKSTFVMFYKYLTHSDLATFGKATKVNSHDDNLLYYLKTENMREIEEKTNLGLGAPSNNFKDFDDDDFDDDIDEEVDYEDIKDEAPKGGIEDLLKALLDN